MLNLANKLNSMNLNSDLNFMNIGNNNKKENFLNNQLFNLDQDESNSIQNSTQQGNDSSVTDIQGESQNQNQNQNQNRRVINRGREREIRENKDIRAGDRDRCETPEIVNSIQEQLLADDM